MKILDKFIYDSHNIVERLWLLEKLIACWIGIILIIDPTYIHLHKTLIARFPEMEQSYGNFVTLIRAIGIIAAAILILGGKRKLTGTLLAVAFLSLSFISSIIAGEIWNYNLHLVWFLLICLHWDSKSSPSQEYATKIWALRLIQLSIALFYFQSGLSKLCASGLHWFYSGQTVQYYSSYLGSKLGHYIGQYQFLCQVITILTGIAEFLLPITLLINRFQRASAIIAMAFHLGVFIVFGIGFWQITILYIAIFFSFPSNLLFQFFHRKKFAVEY